MHGLQSLPYCLTRTLPRKPAPADLTSNSGSKIFQPTDSC
jgi:hypothetical protein